MYVKDNYSFFNKYEMGHDFNTRGQAIAHLRPPKTKLTLIQKNCVTQSINFDNHLSHRLKNMPSKKLKAELKNILINKCLYSINDFFEICSI